MTDRETVELITESPYLQFFIGLSGYQAAPPFDPSMMVHFRKRIGPDLIKVCNAMTKANGMRVRAPRPWAGPAGPMKSRRIDVGQTD